MMSHREMTQWLSDNDPKKMKHCIVDIYETFSQFQKQLDVMTKLMEGIVAQTTGFVKLNDLAMRELRDIKRGINMGVDVRSVPMEDEK